MYINDLPYDLASNAKLFADDTSLFSVIKNKDSSTVNLNSDLAKISGWEFQWKMKFTPESNEIRLVLVLAKKIPQNLS